MGKRIRLRRRRSAGVRKQHVAESVRQPRALARAVRVREPERIARFIGHRESVGNEDFGLQSSGFVGGRLEKPLSSAVAAMGGEALRQRKCEAVVGPHDGRVSAVETPVSVVASG